MPESRPVLNCPVCGDECEVKPFPKKQNGWTISCYGRKPRPHRITLFWQDPFLFEQVEGQGKSKEALSAEVEKMLTETGG